jgi:hypothetical protein
MTFSLPETMCAALSDARRPHGAFEGMKKADVVEGPEVFSHVGLLVNEPPGTAGLLLS